MRALDFSSEGVWAWTAFHPEVACKIGGKETAATLLGKVSDFKDSEKYCRFVECKAASKKSWVALEVAGG